nr:GGDEF domain-containing protein [Alteromonas sediminis]
MSTSGKRQADVPLSVLYVADTSNSMTLQDVRSLPKTAFSRGEANTNLGMAQYAHWFVLTLPTTLTSERTKLLEIPYPLLDSLDVWFFSGPRSPNPLSRTSLGDSLPFAERPINHASFLLPIPPNADGEITAVIRVATNGSIKLPFQIWEEQTFIEYTSKEHIAAGLLFGVLAAIAISNLFFFLTTRNATFIIYTGYVVSVSLTLAAIHGYGFEYLWPEQTWLQSRAVAVFANASIMFALFFTYLLLELPRHNKHIAIVVKALGWVFFASVLFSLFLPYFYLIQAFLLLLILAVLVVFGASLWLSLKGVILARYYTLAWSVLMLSAFVVTFDNLNWFTLPVSSSTLLLYGAIAETLLLAFVLAMSYGFQRDELVQTKDIALAREKEVAAAKDKLLRTEQEAKDELEYKVQERTLELEITLRELSDANRELERLNTIDPLTGIKNRRHFDKRLLAEGRRSRRERTVLTLVMLDIDHFKSINDTYGHDVGDKCIMHIAELAKSFIKRPSDDICRYGGEEFAFILPNTEPEGALALIEQVREAIENSPLTVDEKRIRITASAGVSSGIVDENGGEVALLKQADKALYEAKEQGRNKVIMSMES